MTLKELIDIIDEAGLKIDRVSGFCEGYEHMLDRCRLRVLHQVESEDSGFIRIDTSEGDGSEDEGFTPVPLVIDKLRVLAESHSDYTIQFMGIDNDCDHIVLFRCVMTARVVRSGSKAGLCLLGPEPMPLRDDNFCLAEVIIEDELARKLNTTFTEFLEVLVPLCGYSMNDLDDIDDVYVVNRVGYSLLSYISWKEACESVAAMLTACSAACISPSCHSQGMSAWSASRTTVMANISPHGGLWCIRPTPQTLKCPGLLVKRATLASAKPSRKWSNSSPPTIPTRKWATWCSTSTHATLITHSTSSCQKRNRMTINLRKQRLPKRSKGSRLKQTYKQAYG